MKSYVITVLFLAGLYSGKTQTTAVKTGNPADIQKILSSVVKMPFYQIQNNTIGVTQFSTTTKDFYYSLTIDGMIPDSITCLDMASIGLISIQALAEKEKELEQNQKLLEESNNRLNEVTHEALKMAESANNLQSKVTELENKLNDLEFKLKELESMVKRN